MEMIMVLKYEQLPEFCFRCGFLGHPIREYVVAREEDRSSGIGEDRFGGWLRAGSPPRNKGVKTSSSGSGKAEDGGDRGSNDGAIAHEIGEVMACAEELMGGNRRGQYLCDVGRKLAVASETGVPLDGHAQHCATQDVFMHGTVQRPMQAMHVGSDALKNAVDARVAGKGKEKGKMDAGDSIAMTPPEANISGRVAGAGGGSALVLASMGGRWKRRARASGVVTEEGMVVAVSGKRAGSGSLLVLEAGAVPLQNEFNLESDNTLSEDVTQMLQEQEHGGLDEAGEDDDKPIFVLTDEWREFFAASEAKRKLGGKMVVHVFSANLFKIKQGI
ncbi:hypothetical protein JRO89_XS01G0050700 [Xanthoceras sorbifolium]|uniref:Zinc knuckle CX2CX4HX4C domain-containing protein n=1 Tax=Xanthoceras sorbifolium TaxID=99658 RepID=A0ABQ8IIU2_9ROSI|nr:hypothetical protein JRO89_XS01G0050700 [Xanthoceras sorbifolium]